MPVSSADAGTMPLIEPFVARVLRAQWAAKVISPPYDSMSQAAREQWLTDHPDSFLHVASGAVLTHDHPSEHFAAALRGKAALDGLIERGAYGEPTPPRLFAQQIAIGELRQRAVLGAVRLAEVELRAHEATHPARVQGLATHLAQVGYMASPVVVTPGRSSATADAVGSVLRSTLARNGHGEHLLDVTADDGAHVRIADVDGELVEPVGGSSWASGEPCVSSARVSSEGLEVDGPLYIVDGHHRVVAAAQAGLERLFVAVVPPEQVTLRGFDRTVSVLEVMPRRLLAQLSAWCDVTQVPDRAAARPTESGVIGVRFAQQWYRAQRRVRRDTAVDSDAAFVHDVLLAQLFGITVHTDDRLGYRVTFDPPAHAPLDPLVPSPPDPPVSVPPGPLVSSPPGQTPPDPLVPSPADPPVEILLAGASLDDIYAVADADGTMPPKSTYFMPKARSGIVLMPT